MTMQESRHGSRLGRLLYFMLIALAAGLALAAVAGGIALVFALIAPEHWPTNASLQIDNGPAIALTTPAMKVFGSLAILVGTVLAAFVVVPLVGLMRSTAAGTPFVAANVRRLHIVAATFAVYAVIRIVVPLIVPHDVAMLLSLEGPTVDIGPILMALVVTVLAEVFAQGVQLREDVEGTI